MQCPTCGLFGLPGAQRCDCGYGLPRLPLYCIARRLSRVSLGTALGGGVLIGNFLMLTVWILEGRLWSGLFSPVHGILGGAVTAAPWWHLAGKPDQRSAPLEVRPA